MRNFLITGLLILFSPGLVKAQYAPPAGQEGSTAIKSDSGIFVAWATACEIDRGWLDISQPEQGKVTFGESLEATGVAEGTSTDVVSLGDGGSAVLTFDIIIADGEGWDFAVFENALNDTFLELAFVEVSSDGVNYYSFPAVSLTDDSQQLPTFGELDCTLIHNLAGKYRQGYGAPFDLAELEGKPLLDVQHITHVRITDVIGCIQNGFATVDSQGNKINDPWPTPFETGGFDLDGVGVINISGTGVDDHELVFRVYPSPCKDRLSVSPKQPGVAFRFILFGPAGQKLFSIQADESLQIDLSGYDPGLYFFFFSQDERCESGKIIKQ